MKNVAQILFIFILLIFGGMDVVAQSKTIPKTNSRTNSNTGTRTAPKASSSSNSKTTSQADSKTPTPTRTVKKKKDKDLSGFDLRYQDMVARYNRYFNATIRYMEGTTKLIEDNQDSYQDVLTVYPYNGGDGTRASTEMSAVIDKTSAMIQIRPYSKWVDDAYLLLGKANFLMGDYDKAVQSFKYITTQYSSEIRKKPPVQSKKKRAKIRAKERELTQKEREKQSEALKSEREKAKKEKAKERAKDKKETQKERAAAEKERDSAKKEELKKREEAQKEREQAKKEELKQREELQKERAKDKKEIAKQRAKDKKELAKQRANDKKEREKEKKRRLKAKKKGKKYAPTYKPKTTEVEKEDTPEPDKPSKKEKASNKKEDKAAKEASEETDTPVEELPVVEEEMVEDEVIDDLEETIAEEDIKEEVDEGPSAKELKRLERKSSKKYVSNGMFSHDLVNYDAQIWMIRTYIDMAEYGQAATVLDRLEQDETFPKRLAGEYSMLKAHYCLKRGNRGEAKLALQDAVRKVGKKEGKARLYFILGQLEEKDQNYEEAIAAFKKTIKAKPVIYDMEFHARVNVIRSKMRNDVYSTTEAIRALEKMLKDDKNEELQDQIYFAMAEVAIEAGDIAMATEYFKKAAEVSTANDEQKALAFLRLAEIFFENETFVQAGIFYDSTLVYLSKEYENYEEISRKKEVLSDLVAFSQAVELQDSLQQIANLPNAERVERIEELIAYFADEAEKKKQAQLAALEQEVDKKDKKSDTWLFYNPSLVERGKGEFRAEWGDRPRVNNWRISSKISTGDYLTSANDATELSTSGLNQAELQAQIDANRGEITRDGIMAILPLTEAKMKESNQKIKDGLYGMGKIYNDKLDNPQKAKGIYEELQRRYPDNEYAQEVLYSLYLISQKLGLTADADKYKKQLLSQYSDGKYAKIVQSPDYAKELNKKGEELQVYYEKTYQLFKQDKFDEVTTRIEDVNKKFEENTLQPKFDLLAAMVVGHAQDKENYITALEGVVSKYPEDEVKDKATEILKYLRGQTSEASGETEAAGLYSYNPDSRHYFLVALDSYTSKINSVINNFSDFNQSSFNSDRLKVQQMLLDPEHQVVLIKQFDNADKAMIYYKTVKNKEVEVMQGADVGYQFFVISKSNFTQYFKQKDANAYMEFFMSKYVK
ncbi:MAG: tetratricopeptide repeat protein [Chitinophagales bacterium]